SLRSVGYQGKYTAVSQCITDATRKAVAGDVLNGMVEIAQAPIGTNDPSTRLYESVANTYGTGIRLDDARGVGMFTVISAFHDALDGFTGDLTSENIVKTIKAMPAKELQAAGGMMFRCNGKASLASPAVCTRGGLIATLDAKGDPRSYK